MYYHQYHLVIVLIVVVTTILSFQVHAFPASFRSSSSLTRAFSTSLFQNMSESTNPHKRSKLELSTSSKLIGTHSGTFQADEALGVWLLRQTKTYFHAPVLRSRDMEELNKADIVIDVGGVYDHSILRYDHHQRGFEERFEDKTVYENGVEVKKQRCTKLSASGLVYRHYGREVISNLYPTLSEKDLEHAYIKMYNKFMEAIDAVDTGVEQVPSGCDLVYRDCTGLSQRVARFNPRWNEDPPPNVDERFELASSCCGDDFLQVLAQIVESDMPARSFVEQAVLDRMNVDSSGEIIKLSSGGMPWKTHLYDLEKEYKVQPLIKFVLYTDQSGMWRVQAVTVEGQAFENRLSLPEEWRGVRDEELANVSGIRGSKFCHVSGFIGGNETFEGALEMAKVALRKRNNLL